MTWGADTKERGIDKEDKRASSITEVHKQMKGEAD